MYGLCIKCLFRTAKKGAWREKQPKPNRRKKKQNRKPCRGLEHQLLFILAWYLRLFHFFPSSFHMHTLHTHTHPTRCPNIYSFCLENILAVGIACALAKSTKTNKRKKKRQSIWKNGNLVKLIKFLFLSLCSSFCRFIYTYVVLYYRHCDSTTTTTNHSNNANDNIFTRNSP